MALIYNTSFFSSTQEMGGGVAGNHSLQDFHGSLANERRRNEERSGGMPIL